MPSRKAEAVWQGSLNEGGGTVKIGSGLLNVPYTFKARVEEEANNTNPEELIGAGLASCYAMFLSAILGRAEHKVNRIAATANVNLLRGDAGLQINEIVLDVEGDIPGMDAATFQDFAEKAKVGCPVSQALASVPSLKLNARLVS